MSEDQVVNSLFSAYQEAYKRSLDVKDMSLGEYLTLCKQDPSTFTNAQGRLLEALGTASRVDTSKDKKLGHLFDNRMIDQYPLFDQLYGLEEPIEQIVQYLRSSKQGEDTRRKILYLYGPPSTAKSTLAALMRSALQEKPIYVLTFKGKDQKEEEWAPNNESPLSLFNPNEVRKDAASGENITISKMLERDFGIPVHALPAAMSPWAIEKLKESKGDLNDFRVVKVYPSILRQIASAQIKAGDAPHIEEGKPQKPQLVKALGKANQGILEYAEIFKDDVKKLLPLLQLSEGLNGQEAFDGVVLGHSNLPEAEKFFGDTNNEGMKDRIVAIAVPYVTRPSAEVKIYEKALRNSDLRDKPRAPWTLEMASEFAVMTRLTGTDGKELVNKARVYNGEDPKDVGSAKTYKEYRSSLGTQKDGLKKPEGMTGLTARFVAEHLMATFNYAARLGEKANSDYAIEANPINLFKVMEEAADNGRMDVKYKQFIAPLRERYKDVLKKDIQTYYIESENYGQSKFERYYTLADQWVQGRDYRDPESGTEYDVSGLNTELQKFERPSGITGTDEAKTFRNKIVQNVLRAGGPHKFKWESDTQLKGMIEKQSLPDWEEIKPVISFAHKEDQKMQAKHDQFVDRMITHGYTKSQVRHVIDWVLK